MTGAALADGLRPTGVRPAGGGSADPLRAAAGTSIMRTMVTVSVLGPVTAEVGGAAADLGGPRQRAVLARLAAADGHAVSADRIIDDLWAGDPPPKALAALQAYVSHLRRALEPGRVSRTVASVLVSASRGYALQLPPDAVDAWRFPALLQRASDAANAAAALELLDEALACWSGRAYAESADAAWAAPVAARLEELRLVTVEQRASRQLDLGLAAHVVPEIERHVHEHPLREDAVRLLALALYRSGRQADALAALRRARGRLHDELGVDPGPTLRALEADVLAHAATLDVPAPRSRTTAGPGALEAASSGSAVAPHVGNVTAADRWVPRTEDTAPLLGRQDELRRLHVAAAAARSGARVVWVAGEAGTGKTRLAQAFAAALRDEGWRVAWGRCPEVDGAPPAWPWTEALGGLMEQAPPTASVADRLRPLLEQGLGDASDHFAVVRAASTYIAQLAAEAPLCIVLDDVHRADDRTLQIVRQAVADHAGRPVLVVATYRGSEAPATLEAASASLAAATVDRLDLRGLDEHGVGRLFAALGLPDVDAATVGALTERTGGNPLFVREIARLLLAEGKDAAGFAVPPGIRDVLRQRLARLPEQARGVLRLAAVVGRDVGVDVLVQVADISEDEVLEGLEAGLLAGLLEEPADGRVRFTHALVRDTLYDDLPRLRRSRLHARVLAGLREVAPHDVTALAHHAFASLTPSTAELASEYAATAAARAEVVTAYGEAAKLWRQAIAATEARPAPDLRRVGELLTRLVPAAAYAGDSLGARAARSRALELAQGLGDDELELRVLTCWNAPVVWTTREMCLFDEPYNDALRAALEREQRPDVRCLLLGNLVLELDMEDFAELLATSAEALALARAVGDDELLCFALGARHHAVANPDCTEELEAVGRELLAVATRIGHLGWQMVGHHILSKSAWDRVDLDAAEAHVQAALAVASGGQLAHMLGVVSLWSVVRGLLDGRLDDAWATLHEVHGRMRDAGGANADPLLMIGKFAIGYAAGDTSASIDDLTMLHGIVGDGSADVLARALVDADRLAEARLVWRPGSPVARDACWSAFTAFRSDVAIRLGDRRVAQQCYDELLPYAGSWAGLATAALVFAPVSLTLGELATFLGDDAAAERHFADSLRLCARLRADHWAARTRAAAAAARAVHATA